MLLTLYWEMKANHLIEERPYVPHAASPSTSIKRFGRQKRRHVDLFYNPGNNADLLTVPRSAAIPIR